VQKKANDLGSLACIEYFDTAIVDQIWGELVVHLDV
jgi:hypothetical protein